MKILLLVAILFLRASGDESIEQDKKEISEAEVAILSLPPPGGAGASQPDAEETQQAQIRSTGRQDPAPRNNARSDEATTSNTGNRKANPPPGVQTGTRLQTIRFNNQQTTREKNSPNRQNSQQAIFLDVRALQKRVQSPRPPTGRRRVPLIYVGNTSLPFDFTTIPPPNQSPNTRPNTQPETQAINQFALQPLNQVPANRRQGGNVQSPRIPPPPPIPSPRRQETPLRFQPPPPPPPPLPAQNQPRQTGSNYRSLSGNSNNPSRQNQNNQLLRQNENNQGPQQSQFRFPQQPPQQPSPSPRQQLPQPPPPAPRQQLQQLPQTPRQQLPQQFSPASRQQLPQSPPPASRQQLQQQQLPPTPRQQLPQQFSPASRQQLPQSPPSAPRQQLQQQLPPTPRQQLPQQFSPPPPAPRQQRQSQPRFQTPPPTFTPRETTPPSVLRTSASVPQSTRRQGTRTQGLTSGKVPGNPNIPGNFGFLSGGRTFGPQNVPGRAGADYPVYSEIPFTNFDCRDHEHPGFYADVEAGCQVYHNCDISKRKHTFMCSNGTVFSQEFLICDWWYNVRCDESTDYYKLNAHLFTEPPPDAKKKSGSNKDDAQT